MFLFAIIVCVSLVRAGAIHVLCAFVQGYVSVRLFFFFFLIHLRLFLFVIVLIFYFICLLVCLNVCVIAFCFVVLFFASVE